MIIFWTVDFNHGNNPRGNIDASWFRILRFVAKKKQEEFVISAISYMGKVVPILKPVYFIQTMLQTIEVEPLEQG